MLQKYTIEKTVEQLFLLQNAILRENKTFRKEKGIGQADVALTQLEFLDTNLEVENILQNQPPVQKIVQEHQATPPGLSGGSYQ